MKKTVLLLLLVLTLSCSNDDSKDKQTQNQGCSMKVLSIGTGFKDNIKTYNMIYGTSSEDQVQLFVSEKVYQFYLNRSSKDNSRWIGEVDHE